MTKQQQLWLTKARNWHSNPNVSQDLVLWACLMAVMLDRERREADLW